MNKPLPQSDAIPAIFTAGGAQLLSAALSGRDWAGTDIADKIAVGIFSFEVLRPIIRKQPEPPRADDRAAINAYEDWEMTEVSITTTEGVREMIRKCLRHESTLKALPNLYHTSKLYVAFGLDKK